jgi:ACT domain-containing protein
LEEQNDQLIKEKIDIEENAKKVPLLKSQLDKYKDQVTSLTAEVTKLEASLKAKGME